MYSKSLRTLLRHMVVLRPKLIGISWRNRMDIFAGSFWHNFDASRVK